MDIFLKVTAGIMIATVLSLALVKQNSEISLLLTICVCAMVVLAAATYLNPVLDFAQRLISIGNLDNQLLSILLKIVGIGLISQIAGLVSADAGSQSLAKALQILTTAVLLSISVPLLNEILSLLDGVLGRI